LTAVRKAGGLALLALRNVDDRAGLLMGRMIRVRDRIEKETKNSGVKRVAR
jgi:hypothetical protein